MALLAAEGFKAFRFTELEAITFEGIHPNLRGGNAALERSFGVAPEFLRESVEKIFRRYLRAASLQVRGSCRELLGVIEPEERKRKRKEQLNVYSR